MKSYYLYQKFQRIGPAGNWIPVYPLVYSYNADGEYMPVTKNNDDPACGNEPITQWVETEQYECVETSTPYEEQYLTIESLEDGNEIRFDSYDMGAMTISASTDNGQTWSAFTANDSTVAIATVNNGDKVLLKGQNERYYPTTGITTNSGCFINPSKSFNVYGNIMSLVSGDTFTSATSVSSYAFRYFFVYSRVADASNLVLPATTLANYCYASMFSGCTSLTTAPELPATTLVDFCYHSMFNGCTSLNYIKCLATDKSANWCTSTWLSGVAATGTFVKASSMSGWSTGINGIPDGWTVQDA